MMSLTVLKSYTARHCYRRRSTSRERPARLAGENESEWQGGGVGRRGEGREKSCYRP